MAEAREADEVAGYLRAAFAVDPAASGELLALRRRHRGLEAAAQPQDGSERAKRRAAAERDLAALREEFWEAPQHELQARLAALDLTQHPDLDRLRRRLARVAALRQDVERACAAPRMPPEFAHELRKLLAGSPRACGKAKLAVEDRMVQRRARRLFLRGARILRRGFPQVHALEAEWLDGLRAARKRKLLGRKRSSYAAYAFSAFCVLALLAKACRALGGISEG